MALNPGTKSQIRWLVGREHVGKPDAEIAELMAKRCQKARDAGTLLPGEDQKKIGAFCRAATKFAVQAHQENRGVYHDVMTGRVGAKKRRVPDGTWP